MKVVINQCFGGFSLSPLAYQELAKRQGKECFFFQIGFGKYTPIPNEDLKKVNSFFTVFSVPNPNDYRLDERGEDGTYKEANERSEAISIKDYKDERDNPHLVEVVELLGEKANTRVSNLKVIEIPDGIDFTIEEYDGNEWIAEKHRTWP